MISQPSHALIFSLFSPSTTTILRLCLKHNLHQPPQPSLNPPCTERDPHEPVAAQVLRPLRGRLWLLLDGRRRRVHEAEAPLEGASEEVRAHHLHGRAGPTAAPAAASADLGAGRGAARAAHSAAAPAASAAGSGAGRWRRRCRGSGGRRRLQSHTVREPKRKSGTMLMSNYLVQYDTEGDR